MFKKKAVKPEVKPQKKIEKKIVTLPNPQKKVHEPDFATPESLLKQKAAIGRSDLISFLKGESINLREATRAKCYDCAGFYEDGIADCEQYRCPLYPHHPYNPNPARLRADKKPRKE